MLCTIHRQMNSQFHRLISRVLAAVESALYRIPRPQCKVDLIYMDMGHLSVEIIPISEFIALTTLHVRSKSQFGDRSFAVHTVSRWKHLLGPGDSQPFFEFDSAFMLGI